VSEFDAKGGGRQRVKKGKFTILIRIFGELLFVGKQKVYYRSKTTSK
jgi:hypothetical protein